MATASNIINAAFEKLFKAPDEDLTAEDAATGLRVLGRLLDSYDAYNVYFSSPSALTDTVDVEDKYLDGLECALAVRLTSSGYKIGLDASTQQRALEFDNLVKTQLPRRKTMKAPDGLLRRSYW
jgi:hypothetical protein